MIMYFAFLSIIVSLFFHAFVLFFLSSTKSLAEKDRKVARVIIQEKMKPPIEIKKEPEKLPEEPKKPEEPKPKEPELKKPPEPKKPPLAHKRKKEPIKKKEVKPVQGVTKESVVDSKDPSAIAVPIGNTLYAKDEGIRTNDPGDLDLSARATRVSIRIPELTDDAIDHGVEGRVIVEVYIDEKGVVTKAELKKKIGYGMDKLLIKAALEATFVPRKDASGRAIGGWDQIVFVLVVPS